MAKETQPRDPRNYRIGIDVGTHSVGLAAIEFDEQESPVAVLSAISQIHDGGVLDHKTATTRLAAAGVARRMRRLLRRRRKRLIALEKAMAEWGWQPLPDDGDPYQVWRVRNRLVTEKISDSVELGAHLATALGHMARHRGWRNPYLRVASLYEPAEPSQFMVGEPATEKKTAVAGFKQRVEGRTGQRFAGDVTIAELAVAALDHDPHIPLRMGKTERRGEDREFSYIGGKLLQSDNANEIHAYARRQGLPQERVREIIDLVFAAESPKGSWIKKVGKDPLNGKPRASKATDAFQRFRIVSALANVRLREDGHNRRLSRDELVKAYEYIVNLKPGVQPTWGDIAEVIGKARTTLAGVASTNLEGTERLPARPPVHVTDQTIRSLRKLGDLRDYWVSADGEHRDALVSLISDNAQDDTTQAGVAAWELLNGLNEEELGELDKLDMVAGRAAYSVESLRAMTEEMLVEGVDLHTARKNVFGVDDDWVPPTEPIGAPIGHPSVDRVLSIVARFIQAAEAEWGTPERVVIEHVRDAFRSEAAVRQADRDNQQRFRAKLEQRESVGKSVKAEGRIRDSDVRRFEAVQRQNSQCLYCGNTITFDTAEMDHIVPRKGVGSTNTRNNLVAVCIGCNRSKSNKPFSVWAATSGRDGVSLQEALDRTKHWRRDQGVTVRRWAMFLAEVGDRLRQTEADPEIDARSMESVAWMANELRDRIESHLTGTNRSGGKKRVFVYRGALTNEARRAAGIEDRIPWLGGGGKTRLDRRHHAVDAAVQTLLDESVGKTLAERISLRSAEYARNVPYTWKEYSGASPAAIARFEQWRSNMVRLSELLTQAFDEDRVVVTERLRLRFGSGRIHEDTILPFVMRRVGDAFTRDEIDAAATPQQWIALTRDPDFDEKEGLPENPSRQLQIQGTWYDGMDQIPFFGRKGVVRAYAALAVRGGWAYLGSIHHARIYRWEERGKTRYGMLRVFTSDLRKHRHEDLFSVEPDPSWISMRVAHPSIGRADLSEKEYLGWLVPGDEVLMTQNAPVIPGVGEIKRWKVTGFEGPAQFNFSPVYLAAEGLERFLSGRDFSEEELSTIQRHIGKPIRPGVNSFYTVHKPVTIRRDSLGRPRLSSAANLPVTWSSQ